MGRDIPERVEPAREHEYARGDRITVEPDQTSEQNEYFYHFEM
jgi:hypothetical protein